MKVSMIETIDSKQRILRGRAKESYMSKTSTKILSQRGSSLVFRKAKVVQVSKEKKKHVRSRVGSIAISSKKEIEIDSKFKSDIFKPQQSKREQEEDKRSKVVIPDFNKPHQKKFIASTPVDDIHCPTEPSPSSYDSRSPSCEEVQDQSPSAGNINSSFGPLSSEEGEESSEIQLPSKNSFSLENAVGKLKEMAKDGMTYEQFRGVFIPEKEKPSFTQFCYFRVYEKLLEEC